MWENNKGNLDNAKSSWSSKKIPDIDIMDNDKRNGLILAAMNQHREVIEFLLENGININHQDVGGKSALHYAAEQKNKKMCLFLLMNKIDHSLQDNEGKLAGQGLDTSDMKIFMDEVLQLLK